MSTCSYRTAIAALPHRNTDKAPTQTVRRCNLFVRIAVLSVHWFAAKSSVAAQSRPAKRGHRNDHQRTESAADNRDLFARNLLIAQTDTLKEMRHHSRLESPQLVRCSDEKAVNSRNTAAQSIGCQHLHQGVTNDHANVVKYTGKKEQEQGQDKPAR